jgi:hypothetical protein
MMIFHLGRWPAEPLWRPLRLPRRAAALFMRAGRPHSTRQSPVAERYRSAGRVEKGRILDALCRTTNWHRKHALRALRRHAVDKSAQAPREHKRRYGAMIKDALTALWEASDRVCGKRCRHCSNTAGCNSEKASECNCWQ